MKRDILAATTGIMEVMAKAAQLVSSEGDLTNMEPLWEIVQHLEVNGLKPSAMAASHLLSIGVELSAAGNATAADGMRVLEWAHARGIAVGTVLYSLQMDLLAKAASKGNAVSQDGFALLREMAESDAVANVFTYTSLFDLIGHAIASGRGELADISRASAAMAAAGVAPNGRTRTALLSAYAAAAKKGNAVIADARAVVDAAYASGGDPADRGGDDALRGSACSRGFYRPFILQALYRWILQALYRPCRHAAPAARGRTPRSSPCPSPSQSYCRQLTILL